MSLTAEAALELLLSLRSDPARVAALHGAYTGSGDVIDVLWWRAHPLAITPAGVEDPASAITGLRLEVYSRPSGETSRASAQLASLITRLDEDAEALDRAVTATQAAEPAESTEPDFPHLSDSAASPPTRPVTRRALASVLAIVLVAGIAFAVGRVFPSTNAPLIAGSSLEPTRTVGVSRGTNSLGLLETPQRAADVPPISLGTDIRASSVHALSVEGLTGATAYGARSTTGLVCLATVLATLASARSCVTEKQFIAEGLRLRITTTTVVTGSEGSDFVFFEFSWSSDGQVATSSNNYLFPASPHL